MRLTHIKVENYARLQDCEIAVRNHLVLVGANDVGKSSLLRLLDLLLGSSVAQLYTQISVEDLRDRAAPLLIQVEMQDFSGTEKALFPDEIDVGTDGSPDQLRLQLVVTIDDADVIAIARTAPGGGTNRQLSRDQVAGVGWRYLSATGNARDLRDDRRSALDDILRAVDLGAEDEQFKAATAQFAETLLQSDVLKSLRGDLAAQLSKALPDKVDQDDLIFVPGAAADNDALSDVRLQVTRDGTPHDLGQQSDGMRALYAIALYDLMSVGANVVGIDEPEIHLHPTSQRSLARLLKANPNQKVLATHSADIVGAFDADSIVVVRPGGEIVQPAAGFLSADEKVIVRWWVRDRLEPLTSRRVIAVEGPSDRIVVERAAELTDRTLDRLGVSIVETGGSGEMGAVETLFGPRGFNVALAQLIDADAEDATAKRFNVPKEELPTHSVWVSRRDLEAEYTAAIGANALWAGLTASPMFSPNELANCEKGGAGGRPTLDEVAAFCRRQKYKVKAALVAADLLTAETARAISSIEALLSEATGS